MVIAETRVAIDEMKTILFRNFEHLTEKARAGEQADLETRLHYRFQSEQMSGRC